MISDWNSADGREKLALGMSVEEKLFKKLSRGGDEVIWKSQEGGDALYVGWDMMWRGKTIEIKSNEGWDWKWNRPYDTVCVELVTKAGRPIGWYEGKSDVVAFVNRKTGDCYFYRAALLRDFVEGKQRFVRYNAECVKVKWNSGPEAGFIKKISLNME